MNKKFKILIALTLVVQLLIPVGMLYHHATVRYMVKYSPEYKFKLLDMEFWGYDFMNDETDVYSEPISIEVGGASYFYDKKIAVTVGEDGFADLTETEDTSQTNRWFNSDYCRKNCTFYVNEYSFEPEVDVKALMSEVNKTYGWATNMHENGCYAYVTAKVYKGVFIPIAIYVKGEKVITLHKDDLN